MFHFTRTTGRRVGRAGLLALVIGAIVGAILWSVVGGALFPGGHGFN